MLAAASIEVMDALFGFRARNDAECYKRELLGRSWCRDWGMLNFQHVLMSKSRPVRSRTVRWDFADLYQIGVADSEKRTPEAKL